MAEQLFYNIAIKECGGMRDGGIPLEEMVQAILAWLERHGAVDLSTPEARHFAETGVRENFKLEGEQADQKLVGWVQDNPETMQVWEKNPRLNLETAYVMAKTSDQKGS